MYSAYLGPALQSLQAAAQFLVYDPDKVGLLAEVEGILYLVDVAIERSSGG